jgi:hypothetical protein
LSDLEKKRRSHNHQITPGKHPMILIYMDIISLVPIKNFDNNRYFMIFECNKTKFITIYFIKTKNEITDCFIYFKKHYKYIDLNWIIKYFYDNNDRKYIAGRFQKFLFKLEIL